MGHDLGRQHSHVSEILGGSDAGRDALHSDWILTNYF